MDGTFKTVPRKPPGLVQLFTVHMLYLGVVLPIAFFLTASRTKEVYVAILNFIRNRLITWEVTYVTSDFEIGLMQAIRQVYGPEKHRGCHFHFCQAVWKRIKFLSLVSLCRQEPAAYEVVKMVMALPHLPARRGPPNQMEEGSKVWSRMLSVTWRG
ncbi:hypothetical protein LSTR_LSTR002724 [Laodelphax striatellus]|uniref:MULE transposase domain-containing protein n=1 Tax=Laodelphax striatellus TaxID=195883 RepID=A0A482X5Z5_LAOST|nr:hypothetical protein LSTR_LSTR002724 [Laodelphax striatellus]